MDRLKPVYHHEKHEDHKGYDVDKFLFVSFVSFVVIFFFSFIGSQMEVLRQ